MKTSSTKRVLAFWLAVAMVAGSAPAALAAEMQTLQPAQQVTGNQAVTLPETEADTLEGQTQQQETVTPAETTKIDHIKIEGATASKTTGFTVTVDGKTPKELTATAYSDTAGTNKVTDVTWSIEEDSHEGVTITGSTIKVDGRAQEGTYTIVATPKISEGPKAETSATNTAKLIVKRATPTASTVDKVFVNDKSGTGKIDVTGKKIPIPAGETRTLSATVLDQFGDPYPEAGKVTYQVTKNSEEISVSDSTLTLAEKATGTATITVTCGTSTKEFEVEAVPKASGNVELAINNLPSQVTYGDKSPTVAVTDGKNTVEAKIIYVKVEGKSERDFDSVESETFPTEVGNYRAIASYSSGDKVGYAEQDFAIVPKPIEVTKWTAKDRPYEQGKLTVEVTGTLPTDVSGLTLKAFGTMADDSAGDNKSVTVTAELTGDKAHNYTVTPPEGVKVNIEKASYTNDNVTGDKLDIPVSGNKGATALGKIPDGIVAVKSGYQVETVTDTNKILDGTPTVKDGTVTIKIKDTATKGQTATVPVKVTFQNYNDVTLNFEVTVVEKKNVSDQIVFADKTVVYDGNSKTLDKPYLTTAEKNGTWTYTWTRADARAAEEKPDGMPIFTDVGVYKVTATYQDAQHWGQKTATLTIQEKPAVKSALTIDADQIDKKYDDNYNNFNIKERDESDGYIRLRVDATDDLDRQRINDTYSEWIGMEITPKKDKGAVNVEDLYVSRNGTTWGKLTKDTYGDFFIDGVSGNSFYLWYDTDDRDRADSIYLATDGNGSNKFEIRVDFDAYSHSSSGGSSSSSGSSSTSKVDGDKVSTTTIDRSPSVKGSSASVSISSSALSDALEKNKKEAKHEKADKTFIKLDVKTSRSVDDTTVTVPVKSLDKIAKEDTGLSVVTNQGTLQLDHRALSRIADVADKGEVSIALEEDSKDQYTLMIKDGSSKIIDLGSGDAEITFSYKLKSGESASDVKVYRVGDGSHTWLSSYGGSTVYGGTGTYAAATGDYVTNMGGEYSSSKKKITFSTDALGTFLVTTDNLQTGGSNTNPSYSTFVDVPSYRWSAPYINKLASLGVINGTGGGYFEPTLYVTREEFVKMLAGVARVNVSGYGASSFPDVSAYRWSAPYIEWAVSRGITTGTDGGRFAPTMKITREEMATMIYRYTQSAGKTLPNKNVPISFADAYQIDSWAVTPVSVMQQAGIIDGNVNNGRYTFDPKVPATREECAKMLSILYDLI